MQQASSGARSPFLLENETEYQAWKRQKLHLRKELNPLTRIRIDPYSDLSPAKVAWLAKQINAFNFILFEAETDLSRPEFLQINRLLGLQKLDNNLGAGEDSVSLLQVIDDDDPRARYIPYTDRALNWHTDGYYNTPARRVNAFSLFCVRPAKSGGENFLLDHEIAYLLLRDTAPELMAALMASEMMCVPANQVDGETLREEQSGPVFAVDPASGLLNMRYSSRPRYVVWKDDSNSQRALTLLREILNDSDAVTELKLEQGQGISCNNILHGRQAFVGRKHNGRLFYRARFRDSILPERD